MAASAQLVNLSAKAELKLVEAVATAMPSGQVRYLRMLLVTIHTHELSRDSPAGPCFECV